MDAAVQVTVSWAQRRSLAQRRGRQQGHLGYFLCVRKSKVEKCVFRCRKWSIFGFTLKPTVSFFGCRKITTIFDRQTEIEKSTMICKNNISLLRIKANKSEKVNLIITHDEAPVVNDRIGKKMRRNA